MVKKMQCLLQAYGQAVWLWIQPFKWRLGYLLIFTFFISIDIIGINFFRLIKIVKIARKRLVTLILI